MTEKQLLHRHERRRDRRKARKKKLTENQIEEREWKQAEKILFGEIVLKRFLLPFCEQSKQREIEENIVAE